MFTYLDYLNRSQFGGKIFLRKTIYTYLKNVLIIKLNLYSLFEIVKDYITSGADVIMSPVHFLTKFLNWEKDEAVTITEEVEKMLEDEERENDLARKAFEKQTGGKFQEIKEEDEE